MHYFCGYFLYNRICIRIVEYCFSFRIGSREKMSGCKGKTPETLTEIAHGINLKHTKPTDLCKRLDGMWEKAVSYKKLENFEEAFIFFKRWVYCVNNIKQSREYRDQRIKYDTYFNSEKYSKATSEIKWLTKKVESYCNSLKSKQISISDVTNEPLILPETPNDEPFAKAKDEIKCQELYSLLKSKNVLIIDVRSSKEYEDSKILYFDKSVVHIPAHSIQDGHSASYYEKQISEEVKERYRNRKNADIIVLMDQSSSLELKTLKSLSPLAIMKNTLEKWETEKLKKIAILKGGYREWVNVYPRFTTNPNLQNQQGDAFEEIMEGIEYQSDWLNKETFIVNAKPSPLNNSEKTSSTKSTPKSLSTFKPTTYSTDENISDIIINNTKSNMQPKVVLNKVQNVIPSIDRTTKPNVNVPPSLNAHRGKHILSVMEKVKISTHQIMNYEKEIVKIMKQLYNKNEMIEDATSNKLKMKLMELTNKKEQEESIKRRHKETLECDMTKIQYNTTENNNIMDKIMADIEEAEESIKALTIEYKEVEKKMKERTENESWTKIHKEPLKYDNVAPSTGLKRSHSSPNLVQGKEDKPLVDRMTKPQVGRTTRMNEYNLNRTLMAGNREQRMEPVYCADNHPGITGLKNLGNSCYMNSIIQCLSNTSALATYFTSKKYTHDLNNKSNEVGAPRSQIAEEVAQVIMALWRGQYKSISPMDLKVVSGQYKLQFESYDQQDSHEFLMFLLEYMHNDLKMPVKNRINTTIAQQEWAKAMHCSESVISKLFFGQLRSTITCALCGYRSINYEIFNSLTLSLPSTNKCSLDECLENYVKKQKISGWKCLECKSPREATKKFDFIVLAPVIVIHLNRFGDTGGWLEKKNTAVEFPLTDFNMKPYVANDCTNNAHSYEYDLYAMSNHYGTMDGGHYTAFCKSNSQDKWYKYDDHTVNDVPRSIVKKQSNTAYLLFYMQNRRDSCR